LFVVPEISEKINTEVAHAVRDRNDSGPTQFLRSVISWLVVNSMRVDGVQFNLLCEQNARNVWRKRAFSILKTNFDYLHSDGVSSAVDSSMDIFRERIDHSIENSVPKNIRYSEIISREIERNRYDPFQRK
jgi:hypothetical protein